MKKLLNVVLSSLAPTSPIVATSLTACSNSKWSGKMYIQLGDSITWNDGHTIPNTKEVLKGYRTHFKTLGFKEINNQGYSGACIADVGGKYFNLPYIVKDINFIDYDLVTFGAGVNDFLYQNATMGELKPKGSTFDKTTFYGGFQWMIEKIWNDNPDITIAIFTPFICRQWNVPNEKGWVLMDYINATIKVGELYGIPVLNLFEKSGITKDNLSTYTIDNLHLNNAGYDLVCPVMIDFVNKLEIKK